jgi:lipopolysaccharide export LptBFGC system permease protein LptF
VELPQKTLAAALACGFVSLVGFGFALLTSNGRLGPFHPGIVLGVVFAVMGVLFCVLSFRIKPDSWWREMVGLDDASLDSMAMRRRSRHRL